MVASDKPKDKRKKSQNTATNPRHPRRRKLPTGLIPGNDIWNAAYFAATFRDRLLYCFEKDLWYAWDNRRWQPTKSPQMLKRATKVARELTLTAESDDEERQAKALGNRDKLKAMLEVAQPDFLVDPKNLDTYGHLLTCFNGTLDLATKKLHGHDPDNLLTGLAPLIYDPQAECPRWEQFVVEIMDGDEDLADFLQVLLGYCLTGSMKYHYLPIFFGEGRNGKSTLFKIMQTIMPDYYGTCPVSLLLKRSTGQHPTDYTTLYGKRMCVAHETNVSAELNEALLKTVSGGDELPARGMNENWWSYQPRAKVILSTNDLPKCRDTSYAMWVRLCPIEFPQRYVVEGSEGPRRGRPSKVRKANTELEDELRDELQGILRWLVDGAYRVYRDGITLPSKVLELRKQYKHDQNLVEQFIAERVELNCPGEVILVGELHEAYETWLRDNREYKEAAETNKNRFGRELTRLGIERAQKPDRGYKGLRLKPKLGATFGDKKRKK